MRGRPALPRAVNRRVRRALGRDLPARARAEPPPHPLGGKLELTFACNLRCGFCYTDSPRHTLARTAELSDDEWLGIADQLVATGAIEAVVTGGEPLLRRDLTIAICRRLAGAGLGVTLNTNGWFVDDAVAAALAEAPGLHVHVSVDGPTPEYHDASRGVPGSWRRAVGALDALIRHGVAVHAVHVVTEDNLEVIEETLGMLQTLGVDAVRVTPVFEVGAAARTGGWWVGLAPIERAIDRFRARDGGEMAITLHSGEGSVALIRAGSAPGALLVRPDGAVKTDSLSPFRFGHAIDDGLEASWTRIREGWRDPAIDGWRRRIGRLGDLPGAGTVAYLDEEVPVGPAAGTPEAAAESNARAAPVPRPTKPTGLAGVSAAEAIGQLALRRRYRAAPLRVGGEERRRLVRRRSDGRIWKLNRSASIVLDALCGGTVDDAIADLRRAYPDADPSRLRTDAMATSRRLAKQGLVIPEAAQAPPPPAAASATPDLPHLVPG